MNKKILIPIIVTSVILIGLGYYLGLIQGYSKGYEKGKVDGWTAAKVQAGEVVGNPLENMPETNPFEKVVNPFKEGYINPFK